MILTIFDEYEKYLKHYKTERWVTSLNLIPPKNSGSHHGSCIWWCSDVTNNCQKSDAIFLYHKTCKPTLIRKGNRNHYLHLKRIFGKRSSLKTISKSLYNKKHISNIYKTLQVNTRTAALNSFFGNL